MQASDYLSFVFELARLEHGSLEVRVVRSPCGTGRCALSPGALDEVRAMVVHAMRDSASLDPATSREIGQALFRAVFAGDVADLFRSSLEAYHAQEMQGLRVLLRQHDDPVFSALPWGLLHDPDGRGFLALSCRTPFSLLLDPSPVVAQLALRGPLRVLLMPALSPALQRERKESERQMRSLRGDLAIMQQSSEFDLTLLEPATLDNLYRTLQDDTFHMFCYVDFCAGRGGEDSHLHGQRAARRLVDSHMLGDHHSLRLVVFGVNRGPDRAAGRLDIARSLVRQGIPAVICTSFAADDDAMMRFIEELQRGLKNGTPIDVAVAGARKAVFALCGSLDWHQASLLVGRSELGLFEIADGAGEVAPVSIPVASSDRAVPYSSTIERKHPGDTWMDSAPRLLRRFARASETLCERIHEFADGELDAAESSAFRMHLAECGTCPSRLETILQLAAMQEEARILASEAEQSSPARRVAPAVGGGYSSEGRLCDQLYEFIDGELNDEQAQEFRFHLADCETCPDELEDMLELAALQDELYSTDHMPSSDDTVPVMSALDRPRLEIVLATRTGLEDDEQETEPDEEASLIPWSVDKPAKRPQPSSYRWNVAAAMLAAAATLLVVVGPDWGGGTGADFASELDETRKIEGRLSYAPADSYRPRDVARSATGKVEGIPIRIIGDMEEQEEYRGVAAANLLTGNLDRVEEFLDKAGGSPDVLSDRALLLLQRGSARDIEAAVVLLDGVLTEAPEHPQALWNRGLALTALGLELQAAEAFDKVARLGEQGWSEEARERADALRKKQADRKGTWYQLHEKGDKMVREGELFTPDEARRQLGLARHYLYEAIRTAPTRERLQALRSIAAVVDRGYRTPVLVPLIDRVLASDFAVRGPLAAEYFDLWKDDQKRHVVVDPSALERLLDRLRAAKQHDILLGALRYTPRSYRESDDYFTEYRRLAADLDDPWFKLVADEQQARLHLGRARSGEAIKLLKEALNVCDAEKLAYRCVRLEFLLGKANLDRHRPALAQRYFNGGWQRARTAGAYVHELKFLPKRGRALHMGDDVGGGWYPLVRDYFYERGKRSPKCSYQYAVHSSLAQMLINANRFDEARQEMARARALVGSESLCDEEPPMDIERATVLSYLLQSPDHGTDAEIAGFRDALGDLRERHRDRPGKLALIDHLEGRLLIERIPQIGQDLLRQAIASGVDHPDNTLASKARAYSYLVLIHAAAGRGDSQRALDLLAEELGLPEPGRCALGLARTTSLIVVARDSQGVVRSSARALEPDETISDDWSAPARIVGALTDCQQVDVYARAPFFGRATILPGDIAWRFRTRRTAAPPPLPEKRRVLVVSDVIPPEELKLPALRSQEVPAGAEWIHGDEATPERVLGAMTDATEIEIRAHGLTELDVAHIVLSPGRDVRDYRLTAERIREQRLRGAPVVVLGACKAGRSARHAHESWGLATAFIDAGARMVFASPAPIQNQDADAFFAGIRDAVAGGAEPAIALRDSRLARKLSTGEGWWTERVVVFE